MGPSHGPPRPGNHRTAATILADRKRIGIRPNAAVGRPSVGRRHHALHEEAMDRLGSRIEESDVQSASRLSRLSRLERLCQFRSFDEEL